MMIRKMCSRVLLTLAGVAMMTGISDAGLDLLHWGCCCCDCCGHHVTESAGCGFACSSAVSACCGVAGGVFGLGHAYGLEIASHDWSGAVSVHDSGAGSGGFTGYEGLPNMDGGGVNNRYPYHSYRRPWHHPGPVARNVSIVW